MFNDIIVSNFSNPEFAEELDVYDGFLELSSPVCGDRINVQLCFSDSNVVVQARYQAWGCATSLATGNVFCTQIDGKPIDTACQTSAEKIDEMLGELEPSQMHCLEMLHELYGQLREKYSQNDGELSCG